jgi:hypothetical protein
MSEPTAQPSFERDIKPLFRDSDVNSMSFAFDLAAFGEVSMNADGILERLADGTMPCDAPWAEEQVTLFRDWIAAGKPP